MRHLGVLSVGVVTGARSLSLVGLALLSTTACEQPLEAPSRGVAVSAIHGGYRSEAGDDAVVLIRYAPPLPEVSGRCTGTLIAPNLLVTALHCIASRTDGEFDCSSAGEVIPIDPNAGEIYRFAQPSEVQIYAGPCGDIAPLPSAGEGGAGSGGAPAAGDAGSAGAAPLPPRCGTTRVEPAAYGAQIFSTLSATVCRNDIAFVVLDRSLDLPYVPVRLSGEMHRGERMSVIGYSGVGLGTDIGRHRRDGIRVTDLGSGISSEFVGAAVPPLQFVLESAACPGDSGGPALSVDGAVTGVATRYRGDCLSPYADDYYACLIPFADLAREAFEAAGAEPWLEGEPPPGSAGEAGAAGAPAAGAGGLGGAATGGAAGTSGAPAPPPSLGDDGGGKGCCQASVAAPRGTHASALLAGLAFLIARARRRRR